MNAEALVGTVLGTCTLQKLIGQGGMGAVYLAQQSRPRRQVAVKVLLPMFPSSSNQQAAFLERFRRETDTAASLVHPNIMPVHEYGERDGLAYLVMPYISGGTLRDELEREPQLPFMKVVNYLDQLAAALDVAHERGVVHRDIKPANILLTPEGRLLLSDFGLVKIIAEGQTPQRRLTGAGVPMGTPDYMAPEQVLGSDVDARADIYSLGCILYHMVTGTPPFKGEMPMQVALRHLQMPPAPPRSLRPDLPVGAEQVMLRALAKRPADRYMRAQDLSNAFRIALTVAGMPLELPADGLLSAAAGGDNRVFTPRGLFDPVWQQPSSSSGHEPQQIEQAQAAPAASIDYLAAQGTAQMARNDIIAKTSMTLPSFTGIASQESPSLPFPESPAPALTQPRTSHTPLPQHDPAYPAAAQTQNVPEQVSPAYNPALAPGTAVTRDLRTGEGAYAGQGLTGAMLQPLNDGAVPGAGATMKLTQSMRLVQVPVAGQPGRYLTGLLPMQPPTSQDPRTPEPGTPEEEELFKLGPLKETLKRRSKLLLLVTIVLLVVFSSGTFWLLRTHSQQPTTTQAGTPDAASASQATADVQATATAQANTILTDPLSQNVHDWHIASRGPQLYIFKNGAYHIANNDTHAAIALLPDEVPPASFGYTLTLAEIRGDNTSINNQFGLILRYNTARRGGRLASTFYCFDVASVNSGGEYQFWKYDDSFGPDVNPWTKLWGRPLGREYHYGHGLAKSNTFKVIANGGRFTFVVNGKQLGMARDNSLPSGQIGMLVNLKGTEVAFSNLVLSYT